MRSRKRSCLAILIVVVTASVVVSVTGLLQGKTAGEPAVVKRSNPWHRGRGDRDQRQRFEASPPAGCRTRTGFVMDAQDSIADPELSTIDSIRAAVIARTAEIDLSAEKLEPKTAGK